MLSMRIDETGVRFRITPLELGDLLNGKSLSSATAAGAVNLVCQVIPSRENEMRLDLQDMCFSLHVPMKDIITLRDMGKSKSGIVARQGDTEIALQVDLKTRTTQAA